LVASFAYRTVGSTKGLSYYNKMGKQDNTHEHLIGTITPFIATLPKFTTIPLQKRKV